MLEKDLSLTNSSKNTFNKLYNTMISKLEINIINTKLLDLFWSFLGAFLGIGAITYLTYTHNITLLAPSFGASAVLIYGACEVPMAQPKNVIGGHLISALVGVIIYQLFGLNWLTITLAVSLAITLMLSTNTAHPPGGATAFIAVYTEQNFAFIFKPILIGALILVLIGLLTNYISEDRKYPN
ncbi:MAG: HPP family protein [Candidatus Frackibacter sp. T328-2]|nr:MAG: HPP family protein [Candidatus Frackibacter sp. T328-2]